MQLWFTSIVTPKMITRCQNQYSHVNQNTAFTLFVCSECYWNQLLCIKYASFTPCARSDEYQLTRTCFDVFFYRFISHFSSLRCDLTRLSQRLIWMWTIMFCLSIILIAASFEDTNQMEMTLRKLQSVKSCFITWSVIGEFKPFLLPTKINWNGFRIICSFFARSVI